MAVNFGILGLAVVLVLLYLTFRWAWKSDDRAFHFMLLTGVTVLRMASYMCPSRIRPLYNLFRLYEDLNDTLNMVKVGNELIEKPIKVQSHDARAMRLDVRRWLMQAGY